MARSRDKTQQLERSEARRIEEERISKAEGVARIEGESRAAAEAACVSVEMRSPVEEDRIDEDAALLKQRGKPPRRKRNESKQRGGRPKNRRSAPKRRVGKKDKLMQFVRK